VVKGYNEGAEAGIEVDTFKAHSTRGTASSAARDRGVSIQEILQTTDWTRETTFPVFTIARSILTHSAKQSSMVSACFKQTN